MSQKTVPEKARELIGNGRLPEAIQLLEGHRLHPECAVALREIYLGEHDNDRALPLARILAVGEGAEAHVSRSIIALVNGDLEALLSEGLHDLAAQSSGAASNEGFGGGG